MVLERCGLTDTLACQSLVSQSQSNVVHSPLRGSSSRLHDACMSWLALTVLGSRSVIPGLIAQVLEVGTAIQSTGECGVQEGTRKAGSVLQC